MALIDALTTDLAMPCSLSKQDRHIDREVRRERAAGAGTITHHQSSSSGGNLQQAVDAFDRLQLVDVAFRKFTSGYLFQPQHAPDSFIIESIRRVA